MASVVPNAVSATRYVGSCPTTPQSFIRSQFLQIASTRPRTTGRRTPVQ